MTSELRAFRWFFVMIAAYVATASAVTVLAGMPQNFSMFRHSVVTVLFLFVMTFTVLAVACVIKDRTRPLSTAIGHVKAYPRGRLLARGVFAISIGFFLGAFTSIKVTLPAIMPFWADPVLADLDAAILGADARTLMEPVFGGTVALVAIDALYHGLWNILWVVAPGCVALFPQFDALRARFFAVYFFAWIVLGNVLAGLFLSAGPIFYARVTGDATRFPDIAGALRASGGETLSVARIENYLWSAHEAGLANLGSGISAFPSLHVAMATLYFLTARHYGRTWTVLAGAFLAVVSVGSVLLGWHYAIDGLVSVAAVTAAWMAVGLRRPRTNTADAAVRAAA